MAEFILSAFADEASGELSEQMRICEQNNIKFIEMRGVNGRPIVEHSIDEVKEIKKILDDKGFGLSAVGSPFGKIKITDDFAPHLEQFKKGIEMAHILEAKYMRLFSFYLSKDENADDYENEVIDRMGQFVENANGIVCAHENEKGIYGDIAERCQKLYDTFGGRLKLVFDPANFVQCGVDTIQAFDLLEKNIAYLHIKDAMMADGKVVPAGDGDGNVEYILNKFSQNDGLRFLTLEPHLKVFDGFAKLETEDAKLEGKYTYNTSEEAFCAAATAIKSLLCANSFTQKKDIERGYGIWTR